GRDGHALGDLVAAPPKIGARQQLPAVGELGEECVPVAARVRLQNSTGGGKVTGVGLRPDEDVARRVQGDVVGLVGLAAAAAQIVTPEQPESVGRDLEQQNVHR